MTISQEKSSIVIFIFSCRKPQELLKPEEEKLSGGGAQMPRGRKKKKGLIPPSYDVSEKKESIYLNRKGGEMTCIDVRLP